MNERRAGGVSWRPNAREALISHVPFDSLGGLGGRYMSLEHYEETWKFMCLSNRCQCIMSWHMNPPSLRSRAINYDFHDEISLWTDMNFIMQCKIHLPDDLCEDINRVI